jgi:two-component system response regulator HydG
VALSAPPNQAYLSITLGPQIGAQFRLDPVAVNRIGRGPDCAVVLTDPLCSRVHATLECRDDRWQIRDAESRNGTFVNGQKIDEATLADGHFVRVGSTEFCFRLGAKPGNVPAPHDVEYTQTIVQEIAVQGHDTSLFALSAMQDLEQSKQLLLLYQLSIKLLGCDDPDEVVRIALDLLRDHTRAAAVGFWWVDDANQLKPKLVLPASAAEPVALNESLTELVCRQGRAIWIARQHNESPENIGHYADAFCVPLVSQRRTLGAIQAFLDRGRFRQHDFEFAVSLANILAVALVRARHQTSLATDYKRLVEKYSGDNELVGESKAMLDLKEKIARVARTGSCVLIRGESGVGKELVARAIHRASPRADRPMLTVNCAAIPAELMESHLFGHRAGAFTSADRDHQGYFQQADAGTLFLDEVGEMTLEGQAKLLRILEGHPFQPVGDTRQIKVDVRVIAATNQDLQHYVRQKKFREDLYYRLSVFELHVPPLRQRGTDLALLLDYFLAHFRQLHGRPQLEIAPAARQRLLAYHWPGNVRQLRNVIDSAVVLAAGNSIEIHDLGLRDSGGGELESLRLDEWERRLIAEALKRTGSNVPEAAKLLGIGRATLYRKIDEYGISR